MTWSLRKYKGVRENPIIATDFRHNRLKVPKLGEVKKLNRPMRSLLIWELPTISRLLKKQRASFHMTQISG